MKSSRLQHQSALLFFQPAGFVFIIIFTVLAFFTISCEDALVDVEEYGSIEGLVINDSTGNPVSQASVTTSPATEAIVSDSDGEFLFSDIPTRDYTISVRKKGYERANVSVAVRDGKAARATILMSESDEDDEEPDVSVEVDITNWWNDVAAEDSVIVNVGYRVQNTGEVDLSEYEITFRIKSSLGSFYHNEEGGRLQIGRTKTGDFEKYVRYEEADEVEVYEVWHSKLE